ncbi:WD40-repeat-containing domain protein [Cyathus striatus]|nr:WD40-repeat-containing domain protein [Cyathus striatus]
MRFRTLEIRWHDSKPISTCDFQPIPFKKARPTTGKEQSYASQAYRLATGGEDNHVRLWMVHPNIIPSTLLAEEAAPNGPRQPRVEYLATLSRHSAAVNVVRFSPNGEYIASAGDDGMIIIWAPSSSPQATTYGSDLSPEDLQHEKEFWKPRTTFRCTTMQVYDLAWSPTGEYVMAGSTDNAARVFAATDGKCVCEIAEHSHYVQGVAWDPLNEYIATQSSDRSMHIYRISTKNGSFEAHAVGKNTRMPQRHSRTPSTHGSSRPRMFRSESNASDAESTISDHPTKEIKDESMSSYDKTPLTPATSVASTPSMFPPPPVDKQPSSRRSSFSGSNAPNSPGTFSRYGRSPSPMPPLPAIRSLPSSSHGQAYTNFFRRLTFSPDGGLLLTPAGHLRTRLLFLDEGGTPVRGRKGRPSLPTSEPSGSGSASAASAASTSSVYIYSRANFARPPIAQLPGHKKASVGVRFSPILYELRQTATAALEKGLEGSLDVIPSYSRSASQSSIAAPTPRLAVTTSPMLSPMDLRPITPAASKPSTPVPPSGSSSAVVSTPTHVNHNHSTASIFTLPYRMLYAVATMDTVMIYDTQQAGPFTDMSWSPDGQCLMLSSRDGYCTIVHHSLPLSISSSTPSVTPSATPLTSKVSLPPFELTPSVPKKRNEPPLTPAAAWMLHHEAEEAESEKIQEPPKKKRRVALTHLSGLDS